jgi:hypothetical protein
MKISITKNELRANSCSKLPTFNEIMTSLTKSNITGFRKTDDQIFAQNETNKINKKVERVLNKNLKLWEKNNKNEKDDQDLNVRKKLLEIRKEIREAKYDTLEQKEHFFSKKHV